MKAFIASIVTFLILINFASGQRTFYEYGKLEQLEMRMETSPMDDQAPAVIIFDMGKTYFPRKANKFEVVYERTTRIKILDEEGTSFATINIPLYTENNVKEKLYSIKANVWNQSDNLWKVSEINVKDYSQREINDNYSLATFNIPNVKEGSIIEYNYTISSQFFSPIRGWEFQNIIPTLFSTFEIRMIPFYEYTFLHQGKKPTIQDSYIDERTEYEIGKNQDEQYGNIKYKEKVYTFGLSNMPATSDNFTRIDFQLSKKIDLNGVGLELTDTWDKAIKELLSSDQFGSFIDKSAKKGQDVLSSLSLQNQSEYEQLYSIVRLVKRNYKWNGVLGKYASNTLKSFQETKTGNSGTINLFTVGLLRAAGINAFPVIMQSKNSNKVKTDYPFLHLYDYVLVAAKIKDQIILVDATEQLLPDNQIPVRCINMKGLLVQKFKEEWITCTTTDTSYTSTLVQININENTKSLDISLNTKASGYDGYLLREDYNNDKSKLKEYYGKKGYSLSVESINTEDYSKVNDPYTIMTNFSMPLVLDDQNILIDPFLNEPINKNPLRDKSRDYTTDFYYKIDKAYHSEIIIPEGYTISEKPESFEIKNSMIEVSYSVRQEENKIIVDATYKLLKALYPPNEYERLKSYFGEIVKRFNEPVILARVNQ